MLALTENATEAIEGVLSAPAIPEGAGLRIAAPAIEGAVGADAVDLSITLAATPAETDRVIDQQGARVFVDEPVADYLDDKVLDAEVAGEQVSFVLGERAT